ncbi:MAG: hypothetical protein H6738_22280 [Alphaproteobacteria bacterium]|nr:hypothetical protein [Alphaproteobacteria bacterium]MCB9699528.1 hypothetical protein [Alphaproteobacteria bacterium]
MKPPGWMADATDVSEEEAAAMLDGDGRVSQLLADATEPLDPEVEGLVARAAPLSPAWDLRWLGVPALVVLAALALLWLRPSSGPAPVPLVGERIEIAPPAPVVDRPGYRAEGDGRYEVARDEIGVLATQLTGELTWEVEPMPEGQRFRVLADDVLVEVVGTRFTVGLAPAPWVAVASGRVLVHHAKRSVLLVAGDRWERPTTVAAAPAPPVMPAPLPPPNPDGRVLAGLLGRVESGERTAELRDELRAWAAGSPGGALAAEAQVAALEIDVALSEPDDAVDALDVWLLAHRDDPHRVGMLELRADTILSRGGCEEALPAYVALAAEARGEVLARARARVSLCTERLGRTEREP